jgi:hypothetical protein
MPTNASLETTSHSSFGSRGDYGALRSDSIVNARDETGAGPKTDRVVGVVALVAALSAVTFFVIVVHEVVKLLSN